MLDSETKRRIDTARDILVGKVPDPKSQVEQITIALIYKFMDDMDAESEELGGERKFFAGGFGKYGWAKLMRSGLGGHEALNLYAEAITRMPENPGIPPLFRDIFRDAYLPYRDPETLRAFLKIIDDFTYEHSERLGDAFEYLLSVLGSQGDAGQFRTPRHIIDFIVSIVDPKKNETVLDPACGTAGFLISSYKYILAANRDADGNSTLTPDERGRLAGNFKGYDISPDMVRLSLVNMYLHGFTDPHIFEYDTLTSQDRWNEYADVILANPPFMSPKGGIKPHNRFSVQSKRSEVLFVDYMAEHLTAGGRAAIIVPEGVIFQEQTAYRHLRKMLLSEFLVAVVSLPSGVFNPYSGVTTSILVLDRTLATRTDTIAFFKVENDGFGLGAQRRQIQENDLPQVQAEMGEYLCRAQAGELVEGLQPKLGLIVPKKTILASAGFNLSGRRYLEAAATSQNYPSYLLADVCDVFNGSTPSKREPRFWANGTVPWFTIEDIRKNGRVVRQTEKFVSEAALRETSLRLLPRNSVLLCCTASVGEHAFAEIEVTTNQQFNGLVVNTQFTDRLLPKFLYFVAPRFKDELLRLSGKTAFDYVSISTLKTLQVPLPPMGVQREFVAELEGYQRVMDAALAVLENYSPHISISPDWPMVQVGEVMKLASGKGLTQSQMKQGPYAVYGGNGKTGSHCEYLVEGPTVVIGRVGAYCGVVHLTEPKSWVTDNALYVTEYRQMVDRRYLAQILAQLDLNQFAKVGGQPSISQSTVYERTIPLPSLATQHDLVADLEEEQALVTSNRELVQRFEGKIEAAIVRLWGEDGKATATG